MINQTFYQLSLVLMARIIKLIIMNNEWFFISFVQYDFIIRIRFGDYIIKKLKKTGFIYFRVFIYMLIAAVSIQMIDDWEYVSQPINVNCTVP